jgi:putative sterol carrier protein
MSSFPGRGWVESAATAVSDDPQFSRTSRAFEATIRFDFGDVAYALTVDEGEVVSVHDDPDFVTWDFAMRAPESTWAKMLSETPPPRHHDPLGAWLRGDLTIEGDLKTVTQHLRPLKRMFVVFREVTDE